MFFVVDKPVWPTCNQILSHFKRKYQTKKAWHVGTLDPNASGLLLIATHGSTKLIPYLEDRDKTYEFDFDITKTSASLDLGTPSIDWKGDIKKLQEVCTHEYISKVCETFVWEQLQSPPLFSAIWIDGKRAYKIARSLQKDTKEEQVDTGAMMLHEKKRNVVVKSLTLLEYNFPIITLKAAVSSGTYIRTLAYDIGKRLGWAALVTRLRRTQYGHLEIKDATINNIFFFESVYFHENERTRIVQIDYHHLLPNFPILEITVDEFAVLTRWNRISSPKNMEESPEETLFICTLDNEPVSLCKRIGVELQVIKNDI